MDSEALGTALALAGAALNYPDGRFARAVESGAFGAAWADAPLCASLPELGAALS